MFSSDSESFFTEVKSMQCLLSNKINLRSTYKKDILDTVNASSKCSIAIYYLMLNIAISR